MSITAEELAEWQEGVDAFGHLPGWAADRLIAALKAERAEVERLKKIINEYRSRTISYQVDL